MQALIVSKDLLAFLKNNEGLEGEIHSIFSKAMYMVMASDDLIAVITGREDIAPMSLGVDQSFLRDDRFNRGMKVSVREEAIHFPDLNENIVMPDEVWETDPCFEFKPIPRRPFEERNTRLKRQILGEGNLKGIATVIDHLDFNATDVGSLDWNEMTDFTMNRYLMNLIMLDRHGLNRYGQFILDRLLQFLNSAVLADEQDYLKDYEKIVGFGPGLTPSMDDFIAGMMATFLYLTAYYRVDTGAVGRFNETLYRRSIGKTTRVSEEMLKWASKGRVSKRLREVLVAMVSESDETFESAVRSAIGYGCTSGTDFLTGVYAANCMFALEPVRRGFQ